jgi:hypothetical protein
MSELFVSPWQTTGGMMYFPRMTRKVRLHAEGRLPADYIPFLGVGFDGLRVDYPALRDRVLAGGPDDEVLEWCFTHGRRLNEEEILIWNDWVSKRGWRDADRGPEAFQAYKDQYGLGHRTDILTYFDFYDVDEGRKP